MLNIPTQISFVRLAVHLPHWLQWLLSLNLEDLCAFLSLWCPPWEGTVTVLCSRKTHSERMSHHISGTTISTTPVSQNPMYSQHSTNILGVGESVHTSFFLYSPPKHFIIKIFFEHTEKLSEFWKKLSKHSNTYHWITFCSVCFTVYLSGSLTINPSYLFLCLSRRVADFTAKHFSSCIILLNNYFTVHFSQVKFTCNEVSKS